ncbi:MAG TPA: hypothetical protein PLU43_06840 [Lachnospiraceae bacterium]|nr:hypothetical protein [Lachnospiraceae bacterium]
MQLTIFSCSPQVNEKSASAFIAQAFKIGFTSDHKNTADIYYLREHSQWEMYREKFAAGSRILFVLPLYVDCIPGLLMEFFEYLAGWETLESAALDKQLAFIVQSGFPEGLQLRTCELFLEKLPSHLGCEYAGTLVKGGLYGIAYAFGTRAKEQAGNAFMDWGKRFAKELSFEKEAADRFAAPEKIEGIKLWTLKLMLPFSRLMWNRLARKTGVSGRLDEKPYA